MKIDLTPETVSEIQDELAAMVQADQDIPRQEENREMLIQIIETNTSRLKELVAEYGWIDIPRFGKNASFDAWLIAQHSRRDPEFQRQVLALMKALPKGDVDPQNIAYLADTCAGDTQVYGTQFITKEGYKILKPLKDQEKVDELRAEVGLEPLREYIKKYSESSSLPVFMDEHEAKVALDSSK